MPFVLGAALLIVGMALFTLGADTAMAPIGSKVGASITKSKKLWLILLVSLLLGIIITISEPDLQILANQVPGIPDAVLIGAVAVGVGVFLVIAMLRILIGIRLSYLLIGFYAIVFILAFFVPKNFWAIAFDAGGVTTGPMTVPFIMALGVGVSSIRSDRHAGDDSFGLVALSSIGPVIAVLVFGPFVSHAGNLYSCGNSGYGELPNAGSAVFRGASRLHERGWLCACSDPCVFPDIRLFCFENGQAAVL